MNKKKQHKYVYILDIDKSFIFFYLQSLSVLYSGQQIKSDNAFYNSGVCIWLIV